MREADRYFLTDRQIGGLVRQANVGAYRLRQPVLGQPDDLHYFCTQLADILDRRSEHLLLMCMRDTDAVETVEAAIEELCAFLDRTTIALGDA